MARVAQAVPGNAAAHARQQRRQQAWKALMGPYLLFLLIPLAALLLRVEPASLWQQLQNEQARQAVALSLATSLGSVALTLLLGTPVAYYLSHPHYRLRRWIDALVDLPVVLPPAVAGLALLLAFGRRGLLGGALSAVGITIPFTALAVVLAQTFVSAPLYIQSAAAGFGAVNCELKKAAALDGANRWQTFRYVIAPMAWHALVSGLVMAWARALGEFGATIIFAGNFPGRTQTMPLAIYLGFELALDTALALSLILIAGSFLTLVLIKVFLRPVSVEQEMI